jgi:chromosome segregation protein
VKLKRLEMVGFKSFADRTCFDFHQGLTCIVGPNGCGKSNIVDAFRWIMGEQSAKSLRGSEMQDVIFSGTANRKPFGYAEASLTFSGMKGVLAEGDETDEITVTRRLYRSGESEYLINKKETRLRDIREIFFGTGLGRDAYSIIEQGKIDKILSLNAQDRRIVFEEAAGIMRYKVKKDEASHRLERVSENLARLKDIIDEVASRTRSVKIQAGKARRFQEFSERLKLLKRLHGVHQWRILSAEKTALDAELEAKSAKASVLSSAAAEIAARLTKAEEDYVRLADEMRLLQEELASAESESRALTEKLSHGAVRMKEFAAATTAAETRIKDLGARIEELSHRVLELERRSEELDSATGEKRSTLSSKEDALRELARSGISAKEELEHARKTAMRAAEKKTAHKNSLGAVEAEEGHLALRRGRIGARLFEIEKETADRLCEEYKFLSEAAWFESVAADAAERIEHLRAEEEAMRFRRAAIENDAAGLSREYAAVVARRDAVKEMVAKLEGVSEGARFLRELKDNDPAGWTGMRGLVAEILDVEPEYAAAVEAALGSYADAVLFEGEDFAAEARNMLLEADAGTAIILTAPPVAVAAPSHAIGDPGCLGEIADFVKFPRDLEGVVENLFVGAVLVKDFETARRLASEPGGVRRFVTLDGEAVERGGAWHSGRIREGGGFITRKGELAVLSARLTQLSEGLEKLKGDSARALERERAYSRERDAIGGDLNAAEESAEKSRSSAETVQRNVNALSRESEVLNSEKSAIESDLAKLSDKRVAAFRELKSAEESERESAGQLGRIETLIAKLSKDSEAVKEEAARIKIELAQVSEQAESVKSALASVKYEMDEKQHDIELTADERESTAVRMAETENMIKECAARFEELTAGRDAMKSRISAMESARAERKTAVEADRENLKAAEQTAKAAAAEIEGVRIAASEARLKIETLAERFREETGELLEEVAAHETSSAPAPVLPVHAVVTENTVPCESAATADATPVQVEPDWNAVKAEIEELRQKIDKIGSVNIDAIGELGELESRTAFLQNQYDDLSKAKAQLEDVIRKINKKTREMFLETFEAVRANFQTTFRKLFGGGKADVLLEENVDVLDSGIEIMAKPPGKENRSISLLSGGEKVMTTVALLFSIFQSRPSPVCVLDEVDAALDEANIERFMVMLNEFLAESQFLIITHNKRTMARAGILYGVTMPEVGVSKPLVMEFEEAMKHAAKMESGAEAEEDTSASAAVAAA